MRAVTIRDGHLEWAEHPDPTPGKGELVVRVHAAGINRADLLQRAGFYPPPAGAPADIPGLELAGTVLETGAGVETPAAGTRVMAVVGGGGQAELALVDARTAIPVPPSMPWDQAGGFAEAFTTAYDALFVQCNVTIGDRVLVHGAAGGVGTAAVQLAAAAGASVAAGVRDPRRWASRLSALIAGVDVVDEETFESAGPFDVVVDTLGGSFVSRGIASLATGGRICVLGLGAGGRADIDLGVLMARRGVVRGSTLRARPLEDKATLASRITAHVVPLLQNATLAVPIAATFSMADAERAYERFDEGDKFGKIVLLRPEDRDEAAGSGRQDR